MRKVVVTGAAGFIGGHLVRRLAPRCEVVGVDSLKFGRRLHEDLDGVRMVRADLGLVSVDALAAEFEGADAIFHLAAEKLHNAMDDSDALIASNVRGTQVVVDAAGRAGVSKVCFASSLYAYGRIYDRPMREEDACSPHTIYGATKLAGEHLVRVGEKKYGFDATVLRLFFVYGTEQFSGLGYPSVIVRNFRRMMEGDAPRIFGTGRQVLDYVHVDDVLDALEAAAAARGVRSALNIGTGLGTSVADLTGRMANVAGVSRAPIFDPPDWTEGTVRVADLRLAAPALSWKASRDLDAGLREVWGWLCSTPRDSWGA